MDVAEKKEMKKIFEQVNKREFPKCAVNLLMKLDQGQLEESACSEGDKIKDEPALWLNAYYSEKL